ncbi:MAG: hypothetical protein QOF02_3178 [Blastocatellia bacterium]|jgi:hypothetical protein|nr:hypothetical protein [Blastocatellia bacterium]
MDANSRALLSTVVPELQRRVLATEQACNAQGVSIVMHSGRRTYAQQLALWNARASNPNPAARPGTSRHETGLAVDMTPSPRTTAAWNVLWNAASNAGLALGKNFSRSDPPHFELPSGATDEATAGAIGFDVSSIPPEGIALAAVALIIILIL